MKIYFNFLVYFYLSAQVALAQEENLKFRDSPLIERRTVMLQNRYFILGEPVLQRDVIKLMKPYKDAYKEMKASRRWLFCAELTVGIGVGIIIGELISTSDNEGFNFINGGIGAGMFLLAIPLSIKADRKADSSISLYNARQSTLGNKNKQITWGLALNDKGIGFRLQF